MFTSLEPKIPKMIQNKFVIVEKEKIINYIGLHTFMNTD